MIAVNQSRPDMDAQLKRAVRRHLLVALFVSLGLVGGLGAWASFAKISGAVVTSGRLVVEGNIKQVQHREGGIVKEIRVRNGDVVEAGDLLIRLDDTVTRANLAIVTRQLDELYAQERRLTAERDGTADVGFVPASGALLTPVQLGQQLLFEARRDSVAGQKKQLFEQINQLETQTEGLAAQLTAKADEISLIDVELDDVGSLVDQQLASKSRATALSREKARLSGEHGDLVSQIAQVREAIGERQVQILQIDEGFRADVLEQMQEVRSEIAKLEEQKIAAMDELRRVDIRAPRSGFVHQLAVHTIGGVVAPGETVMLVVPREDQLIIETQVRPVDVDQLGANQKARIRFPSFDNRTTPELNAHLVTLSADLNEDERTGASFYTARLALDNDELSRLNGQKLIPGMPVEAFLTTADRTVLSYLVKPMVDQVAHAMRER